MTLHAFVIAVMALLCAPGPTNTLMALAGSERGSLRPPRLLPAEILGYLTTILPIGWLGAATLARWPVAAEGLKLMAAGWVLFLAVRLWRLPAGPQMAVQVSAARVYVTTVLNPKALIVALVLLPMPGEGDYPVKLAAFVFAVAVVAMAWGMGGALLAAGDGSGRRVMTLRRGASACLALLSAVLVAGALAR